MQSLLDTDVLMKYYQKLWDEAEDRDSIQFFNIYDEVKSNFARYLLFLFHISHIVVLSHPGSTFDTSYIQYFKAIDSLRYVYIFLDVFKFVFFVFFNHNFAHRFDGSMICEICYGLQ